MPRHCRIPTLSTSFPSPLFPQPFFFSSSFQGSLNTIANRCLTSGTNGMTFSDATCYMMTTAGSDGFLNLLPIFLDHILNPTLNESFFTTEVRTKQKINFLSAPRWICKKLCPSFGESVSWLNRRWLIDKMFSIFRKVWFGKWNRYVQQS